MNLRFRLTVMDFLQLGIWGTWLITIGNYWFQTKGWNGSEFGAVFSCMGISSLFMPALMGAVADRWMNAERLYGLLHLLGGVAFLLIPQIDSPQVFFWGMLAAMLCYMPTMSLLYSIAYTGLKNNGQDIVQVFPKIRIFGTIGFIIAMWSINLSGNKSSENMFYFTSVASFLLAAFSLLLPKCPPLNKNSEKKGLLQILGLDAFALFKEKRLALFFLFSILIGVALQLGNMYGDVFIDDFKRIPQYADSPVVRYSTLVLSISQISETLFFLSLPFVLKRFGIQKVMLISIVAWALRFGLLGFSNPGDRLWMIVLSCIIYGVAFDFFNISGSMFLETSVKPQIRSGAQGLFLMMTNGMGSILGGNISGRIVDRYFTTEAGTKEWPGIWFTFAAYAAVVAVLFVIFFRDDRRMYKQINPVPQR